MNSLLERLSPGELDLKGRIVAAFYDNPFLEADASALALRFQVRGETLASALDDLCACGVMGVTGGRYRFEPGAEVYADTETLAAAYRGEDARVRQQVVEQETLGRLREALAVTNREVAAILEMVPAGVLLLDRYGHVLKANALGWELLGLVADTARADVCGRLGLALERVLEEPLRVEVDLERPLEAVSRPFRVSGSEAGAVVVVQDVSDRRDAEAQAEQLREAFFSMIRHELKKPVLTVERCLAGGAEGESLAHARAAVAHLSAMVDDLLFLARLERDPMAVSPTDRVSLRFLLAGSDLAFRGRALGAKVKLIVQPPAAEVVVEGDERRLSQVVGNLLDNAIKFASPGGVVMVAGGEANGEAWVSVTDSGPGVPQEEWGRIFEAFYQVRTDDARPHGLGLGLAICHRVARAHGGRVEVSRGDRGGARFTVRLPLIQAGGCRND